MRRTRWIRVVAVLVALLTGVGTGIAVASSSGGEECGTTGDVGYCVDWGVDGFATRLAWTNKGSQAISSVQLTLPPGTSVTGEAGNTGCTAQANVVECKEDTAPGATKFVDIVSSVSGQKAVGTTATVVFSDASGAPQPAKTVTLQSSSTAATTTSSTPPTSCETTLEVKKVFSVYPPDDYSRNPKGEFIVRTGTRPGESLHYYVYVENTGTCVAKDVVVTDVLPDIFKCTTATWDLRANRGFPCGGRGARVHESVGDIPPGKTVIVHLDGFFVRGGTRPNVAFAEAANAKEASSNRVVVEAAG